VSQLKQQAALAEAEAEALRTAATSPALHTPPSRRPTADAATVTDADAAPVAGAAANAVTPGATPRGGDTGQHSTAGSTPWRYAVSQQSPSASPAAGIGSGGRSGSRGGGPDDELQVRPPDLYIWAPLTRSQIPESTRGSVSKLPDVSLSSVAFERPVMWLL